jgi:hypothetical protein
MDIEIDDFVRKGGLNSIQREVDNGDFDFGIFVFNSVGISCINEDGKFSDQSDSRSIFKYSRDKTKVTINFFDGESNDPTTSFKGIVDERATKVNFVKNDVRMVVLSEDSIINRVNVSGGTVVNGQLASVAIKSILNIPSITTVLNYDPLNINVSNDYIIDDGSYFDNLTCKEALDQLCSLTNSVLIVEDFSDIIVRSRDVNTDGEIFRFYGENDTFGRQNILQVKNYNTGLHRTFNSVKVGSQISSNEGYIQAFGDNSKTIDFEFITSEETQALVAENLMNYWKAPKIEMEIVARTKDVKDLWFFDLVSVDYPLRVKPAEGETKLPVYGVSRYGESVYPRTFGNIKINPKVAFKVIGKTEDPSKFTTIIKLRQVGFGFSDGSLASVGTYYGSAIYGEDDYMEDPARVDPNRISVYGAGKYGTMIYR